MPWVIEGKNGGFITRHGHADFSIRNAWRFKDKEEAERIADGLPVLADIVRLGVDRPCAIHKGPAGDCKSWNCVCY